jgi:hypothetical protein
MSVIFLLWYVHAPDTVNDQELMIGAYGTEEAAKSAIGRLSEKPGFQADPSGFQICPYQLNEDHWTEGFRIEEN